MNIVVCLKQVPGNTEVKINPETNTLIRQGIENIINPFDTYALEEGVRLKEQHGGKVVAVSMGPPQAETMLKEAISLGADEAMLVCDGAFAGADTWATAYTLSRAVASLEPVDLVICGRQTIDGDTGQVGPELAEMLDMPFVAYVSQIEEIAGGRMRAHRMIEEGHQIVETALPAVITVTKDINKPRLPSLRGQMRAKGAKVPVQGAAALGVAADMAGLAGSCTQVIKIFFPQLEHQAEMLSGDMETQVDTLITRLKDLKLC